jgi:solute carrier family 25 carnitine/acylcarnitine transporter 20/29
MSSADTKPVAAEVKTNTASSVKSFLSGGFGGMASVLVG